MKGHTKKDQNQKKLKSNVSSSYHLCVEYFSQLSFDSEMYTKSAAVADCNIIFLENIRLLYTSESNESWEKHSTQR